MRAILAFSYATKQAGRVTDSDACDLIRQPRVDWETVKPSCHRFRRGWVQTKPRLYSIANRVCDCNQKFKLKGLRLIHAVHGSVVPNTFGTRLRMMYCSSSATGWK